MAQVKVGFLCELAVKVKDVSLLRYASGGPMTRGDAIQTSRNPEPVNL